MDYAEDPKNKKYVKYEYKVDVKDEYGNVVKDKDGKAVQKSKTGMR